MIETQLLKGNLIKQEHSLAFTLNQYDKNISYKINLIGVNGNVYTLDNEDVITIEWLKPNGRPFLQSSNITKGDTYITILIPEAVTQYAGVGSYNIIITNGDTRKGTIKREYSVIANSMRNGTSSEDMITDVVTELRELSATLIETVQNNQELINNNTAATKQDILNVNSSLEEKAKDINNIMKYKRKFEPKLGVFMDLNPGGYEFIGDSIIETRLARYKEVGIEKMIIQPWICWDNDTATMSLMSNSTIAKYVHVYELAQQHGIAVSALKIHFYLINLNTVISSGNMTTFLTQYKSYITNFATAFKDKNIDYLIALNECQTLYKSGTTYKNDTIDILNIAKNQGFKVGISTMGALETVNMDDDIKSTVDAYFTNCYPKISYKLDKTNIEDSTSAWENCFEFKCLKRIKQDFGKPLIMSETGCNDYYECLTNPGEWVIDENDTVTNGKAPALMLEGLFRSNIKDYIDEVWWCYEQPLIKTDECKNVINKYIGGYINE